MPYKYKRPGSPYYYIGFTEKEKVLGYNIYSTKLKNGSQVDEILKNLRIDIKDRKKRQDYNIKSGIIMSEAFLLYCRDREDEGKKYSQLTIDSYEEALKHLYDSIGDKSVKEYSREDYHTFVKSMSKLSQNSRAIYSIKIYAIFNWLVKEKFITENRFKRIAEQQKELRILTHDQIKTILDYAHETKYFNFIRFMVLSAFRLNEAVNITWTDIGKKTIRVKGKGNKLAYIPIIKPMRKFLKELPRMEEKIFHVTGSDMVYRFWQRVRKKTRIVCTSHDMRKFCLSEMANAGVPINFVKEYARHSSINTTLKYYIRADVSKISDEIDKKVNLDFV